VPLSDLVTSLREFTAPNVFNPWRDVDPLDRLLAFGPSDRRGRLRQHFDCAPRFLLIGEAPGYQGCHFSGVPFTNEKLILDGAIPRVTADQRITKRPLPWSEPSATIVWRTLHELGIAESTVMWNAFAWHPHKPGEPMSNRTPTLAELAAGKFALKAVLEHFHGVPPIAVGKAARYALEDLNVPMAACVRHPSMGGATAFRDGMRALVT
jgi:hypothetical protein